MTTATSAKTERSAETKFKWPLCYEAENFILRRIDAFLEHNNFAHQLAKRMRDETGTLIVDWTDHLILPATDEEALRGLGFVDDPLGETVEAAVRSGKSAKDGAVERAATAALWHPEAILPRVLIAASNAKYPLALAIRPEFVAEFAGVHGITSSIKGEPFSRFRKILVSEENGTRLFAVERRGYRGYITSSPDLKAYCAAGELFQKRKRIWDDDAKGFARGHKCLKEAVDLVGRDLACHLFFRGERAYWEKRNRAGQEQKRRQGCARPRLGKPRSSYLPVLARILCRSYQGV